MSTEQEPLKGLRVVELAALAPGPFLGLLLASYGASVVRIDRPSTNSASTPTPDPLTAHKQGSIPLNLKSPSSRSVLHSLLSTADILIDPFRPNALESLSLSPSILLPLYPRLIVLRLTGFRRDGKWRDRAGHDINYLAVSGVLSLLSGNERHPPANFLADFAAGGLNAFAGVLTALIKRQATGKGGVVDVNMVDGSGFLATFGRLLKKTPVWSGPKGTNLLDGGCPYYMCYECKDRGKYVAVAALEPQFFSQLLQGLELRMADILPPGVNDRGNKKAWPHIRTVLTETLRQRTRHEWEQIFQHRDACVTPVMEMGELEAEGWTNRKPFNITTEEKVGGGGGGGGGAHPDDGIGWSGGGMVVGENADAVLEGWLGWKKGRDWIEDDGAVVVKGWGASKECKL